MIDKDTLFAQNTCILQRWFIRPNPEDQINKKSDDRKNDRRTENSKSTVLQQFTSSQLQRVN